MARLKALVTAGILERRQYQSSPPRHDYHLTAAGRELIPVMYALRAWGDKWAVGEPSATTPRRRHRHCLCPDQEAGKALGRAQQAPGRTRQ